MHATWIEFKFLNLIQIHQQWNSNSIEKKQDANWCKRYWKYAYDYGVERNFKNYEILKPKPIAFASFKG